MKLIHLYRIYKFVKNNDGESLKEYSKSLSLDEVKSLRIKNRYVFKIVSLLGRFYLRNKSPDKGEPIPEEHSRYYKIKPLNELIEFSEKVMENQSSWNVLKLLDGKDEGKFLAVEKEHGDKFDGLEDALQWGSYYCTSLIRAREYYEDKTLVDEMIKDLLVGISYCVTDNAVKRHPLESIDYDLEPISQDMVSGLIQLLLVPTEQDYKDFPMLQTIKDRVAKVFKRSDYSLMYPDGTVNSYDLKPNFIYNHLKSFAYTGLRMVTGEYNDWDRYVVQQMLRIMPYSSNKPEDRSMYGSVVAVNFIEAIALNDRELLLDAIDWVQYLVDSSYEMNPEFDSVLSSLYREQGYKTKMEEYADRTVKGLSSMVDIGVEKPGAMITDPIKGNHPRPAVLRRNDDWFWQRRAYGTGVNTSSSCNMIEFSGPLARVLPVMYYPQELHKPNHSTGASIYDPAEVQKMRQLGVAKGKQERG